MRWLMAVSALVNLLGWLVLHDSLALFGLACSLLALALS